MNQFIDIMDRTKLRELLMKLDPKDMPLWGKMKPQQMVEHLTEEVSWTNGRNVATCDRLPAEAEKSRQKMIYTDVEIARNVVFGQLPAEYTYPDLKTAIAAVMHELDVFDKYFETPGATSVHGAIGPLNYKEWQIYHGKHFTHHFKQFGLIAS